MSKKYTKGRAPLGSLYSGFTKYHLVSGFAHIVLLLVFVMVAIGGIGYLMFQNGQLGISLQEEVGRTVSETQNTTPTPDSTGSWKAFSSDTLTLKYPPDWEVKIPETTSNEELTIESVATFYPTDNGNTSENINFPWISLIAYNNPDRLPISEYGNDWEMQPGIYTPNASPIVVSGQTAYYLKSGGACAPYDCDSVSIPNEDKIYVLDLQFGPDQETEYKGGLRQIFNQILSTFKFVDNTESKNEKQDTKFNTIESEEQSVNLIVPKYLDGTNNEKETYNIIFPKVSLNSKYAITNDLNPKLIISDSSYELALSIPKDGGNTPYKKIPPKITIATKQFGDIYRIANPYIYYSSTNPPPSEDNKLHIYTNEYVESCPQWSSGVPACALEQVGFTNPTSNLGTTYLAITCRVISEGGEKLCDSIIQSLTVDQLE